MEWIIYIFLAILSFAVGWFGGRPVKDDGIVIINEQKVEVIFRDPYSELIKKKYVCLKIET